MQPDALARQVSSEVGEPITIENVTELARFIIANNLALEPPGDNALSLARQEAAGRHSLGWRLVHNYLFFRVPLVRPERFLRASLPIVAPLLTRTAFAAWLIVTLAGLYFASRQWDTFVATFLDFMSLEGLLTYGVALIVIKALHELGHAYSATRLGVRVNTMGVAFMVLTPILYTDVTDAWRLREKRDKLAIDAAGIAVEMALAGLALFLWAFLPDGPLRSVMFVTATTSLAVGLLVNLNPLMRFDGYHILADAWQVPNLQSRSNDMAIWWLREVLFGLGHSPPEHFERRQRMLLIGYALLVWIYRLVLFIGIALIVYHLFFKALGIALFVIEIVWFILLPIFREIAEWWKMRRQILQTRRSAFTIAGLGAALAVLLVPWSGTISVQGVALSDVETRIYAPRPARIEAVLVTDGKAVVSGQPLIKLEAPDLDHEVKLTRAMIDLAHVRLARIAGDAHDRSDRVVIESELSRHTTKLTGLMAEKQRLKVTAPHPGLARDVDLDLAKGQWIDEVTPIARIVGNDDSVVHAYVAGEDLWRLTPGAAATFVPEDPLMARRSGVVSDVVQTGVRNLELPYLASVYGGAVASDRAGDNEIVPRAGRHLVRVRLEGGAVSRAVRGTLLISGARESIAAAFWRRVLQVLVRESSA